MRPNRILAQHGNVISADFRPRNRFDIEVIPEVLYADDHVHLARFTLLFGGKVVAVEHITVQN